MTQSASASDSADQHLVEYDVERRVQLTFAVSPEQAKKLLPASWQVASMPPGPSEGANFMVAFRNTLLTVHYNADGEARVGEQDRGAILLRVHKKYRKRRIRLQGRSVILGERPRHPGPL